MKKVGYQISSDGRTAGQKVVMHIKKILATNRHEFHEPALPEFVLRILLTGLQDLRWIDRMN
jgi:hypothetical protein